MLWIVYREYHVSYKFCHYICDQPLIDNEEYGLICVRYIIFYPVQLPFDEELMV